ncbi:metallophosphoesterase [Fructilactobacillus lindneri]|uniref:Metallophosphoesterase n=2 Tax=Fructilactobacillus lindneri TaxID=53444 RepID=A0A0R2JPQ0_9LACO|nr:DNA repair exonuclease [Fructilactobacillus lindneri]ANZ58287.1 metallophosphoesterase [Fructilactobacillus lindneri]ANZ59609.1 metallophosphoesterase [Fructilactobacillus lindneri]KRN79115.1 metallophosphoesterase [Fructilactobacillus lindneri DSM 20690 = JCM 11027]POG98607.1 metallophosphoesterase [Fructilactobacillus lindneri]POH03995.1 metallophosphoesterase [Fructilactobacillus lindneri]
MKFIHAADLHLDTPFEGIRDDANSPQSLWKKLQQAPYDSFTRIVNDAIEEKVDFVLLVGDLFDGKNQSVAAVSFFIDQLNRLDQADIPVLLSFGNHDFQKDDEVKFAFPKNVFVFPSEVTTHQLITKDGEKVKITGFSYDKQAITEDMVAEFPTNSDADYQIGMVHGAIKSGNDSNYAPFTINEMIDKGYDYWALGHIHKRQELNQNPLIEYPGDIQGRHKNEAGKKGYLMVTDADDKLHANFVSTSEVDFTKLKVKINGSMNITDVVNQVLKTLEQNQFTNLKLLDVILVNDDNKTSNEVTNGLLNDLLIESIQQELKNEYQELNGWVYEINLDEKEDIHFSDLDESFWNETQSSVFNHEMINNLAKKLFKNAFIRDNFSSDEALQNLLDQSKILLKTQTEGNEKNSEN